MKVLIGIGGFLIVALVLVVVGTIVRNVIDDSLAEGPRTLYVDGVAGSSMVFDRGTQGYDIILGYMEREGKEPVDGRYKVSALEFFVIADLIPRDEAEWVNANPESSESQ